MAVNCKEMMPSDAWWSTGKQEVSFNFTYEFSEYEGDIHSTSNSM